MLSNKGKVIDMVYEEIFKLTMDESMKSIKRSVFLDLDFVCDYYPNKLYIADYLPKKIELMSEFVKKEIYYDGVRNGIVEGKKYDDLVSRWKKFIFNSLDKDSYITFFSTTIRVQDYRSILGKTPSHLVKLLSQESFVMPLENTKDINMLLLLCFAGRIGATIIDRVNMWIIYVGDLNATIFCNSRDNVEILKNKLAVVNLFLRKYEE
ncbi:MAG: hypothetical protein ACLKAK_09060 [Alkaliphilus sp.]